MYHSDLKCQITFGNGFWVLNGGNRSIVLIFYQKKLVFALKKYPRPQRPKRPMKANKGQQSPKLQISLLLSLFNVKSSTNVNMIPEKCLVKNLWNYILLKMLSVPTDTNEIMVLSTSFVSILHGKTKISSISFPQQK